MKTIVHRQYGRPELLEQQEVPRPAPAGDEVLVRVHAMSANPADWHRVTGLPYLIRLGNGLRRPEVSKVGLDFAGRVESVGQRVTQFRPGDEVFGTKRGAFAEYVCVREDDAVVPKPAEISFEQAAAVPIAALTALQALRDKGGLRPGQQVLVNGAAGGVGTFAVQLARAFGAEVTGVCSARNVELVRSLGATRVIDYTREDFTRVGRRYDLLLDNVGTRSIRDRRRVLRRDGTLVTIAGPKTPWLGPIGEWLVIAVAKRFGRQRMTAMLARPVKEDLATLAGLLQAGEITPVIDRRYVWPDVAGALAYVGTGHARGKVVITHSAPGRET